MILLLLLKKAEKGSTSLQCQVFHSNTYFQCVFSIISITISNTCIMYLRVVRLCKNHASTATTNMFMVRMLELSSLIFSSCCLVIVGSLYTIPCHDHRFFTSSNSIPHHVLISTHEIESKHNAVEIRDNK